MTARVRVEAKRLPSTASRRERDDNLQRLLKIFKRACEDYGIPAMMKEKESFVRECDKRRWKRVAKLEAARNELSEKERDENE